MYYGALHLITIATATIFFILLPVLSLWFVNDSVDRSSANKRFWTIFILTTAPCAGIGAIFYVYSQKSREWYRTLTKWWIIFAIVLFLLQLPTYYNRWFNNYPNDAEMRATIAMLNETHYINKLGEKSANLVQQALEQMAVEIDQSVKWNNANAHLFQYMRHVLKQDIPNTAIIQTWWSHYEKRQFFDPESLPIPTYN